MPSRHSYLSVDQLSRLLRSFLAASILSFSAQRSTLRLTYPHVDQDSDTLLFYFQCTTFLSRCSHTVLHGSLSCHLPFHSSFGPGFSSSAFWLKRSNILKITASGRFYVSVELDFMRIPEVSSVKLEATPCFRIPPRCCRHDFL